MTISVETTNRLSNARALLGLDLKLLNKGSTSTRLALVAASAERLRFVACQAFEEESIDESPKEN